jgi:hypothetical protein
MNRDVVNAIGGWLFLCTFIICVTIVLVSW